MTGDAPQHDPGPSERRARHSVFLSYSSQDKDAADAICRQLEAAGIICWIAPRDIASGSRWGGSIVDAIEASRVILVVFSHHSNDSPQVVRELECAVGRRLPLLPIRIDDTTPTQDMKYFLGVSHWFNAYPEPLEHYLPQIVATTQHVLDDSAQAWRRRFARLPQTPRTRTAWILGAVLVLGLLGALAAFRMKPNSAAAKSQPAEQSDSGEGPATAPATTATPQAPPELSPKSLVGRWQGDLPDRSGQTKAGVFDLSLPDVQPFAAGTTQLYLNVVFSDDCPFPFSGARGQIMFAGSGANIVSGPKDSGTFMVIASGLNPLTGTYRVTGADEFVMKFQDGREVDSKRVDNSAPLTSAAATIFPADAAWPMTNVPAMANRALDYVRAHWQADATLTQIELTRDDSQTVGIAPRATAKLDFYSSGAESVLFLTLSPGSTNMLAAQAGDYSYDDLPAQFVDLPKAADTARQQGMRGKQLNKATLRFEVRENTPNGIYRTVPKTGPYWTLVSSLGEVKQLWAGGP